jgi:hypothetical protein
MSLEDFIAAQRVAMAASFDSPWLIAMLVALSAVIVFILWVAPNQRRGG